MESGSVLTDNLRTGRRDLPPGTLWRPGLEQRMATVGSLLGRGIREIGRVLFAVVLELVILAVVLTAVVLAANYLIG